MQRSSPVYIVTGANRGIGREICRQLALTQPDATVVLTARDPQKGELACQELQTETDGQLAFCALDVTSAQSAQALAAFVEERWGGFDVLINNAGYASSGPALDQELAERTLGINVFGLQQTTETLLPLLRNPGRIINVSSGSGEIAKSYSEEKKRRLLDPEATRESIDALMHEFIRDVGENQVQERGWPRSAYKVSKAGLNALTRLWHRSWQARGLTVAAVCPGWVRTDMGGSSAPRDVAKGAETPVWLATAPLAEISPGGRFFRDKAPIAY